MLGSVMKLLGKPLSHHTVFTEKHYFIISRHIPCSLVHIRVNMCIISEAKFSISILDSISDGMNISTSIVVKLVASRSDPFNGKVISTVLVKMYMKNLKQTKIYIS